MKKRTILSVIIALALAASISFAGPKISRSGGGGSGSGDVTAASTAQTWGDGTGPVVWTFSVTGTDPTISVATAAFTINTDLALGANDITMTGSLGATGARLTKGWFTDLEITNSPTVGGTALSAIYQPLDTQLTALASATTTTNLTDIAALTPTANAVLGWNGSTVMSVLTTHSHLGGSTGYQFYGPAGNVGLFNVNLAGSTTGATATLVSSQTTDVNYVLIGSAGTSYVPDGHILFSGPTTTKRTKTVVDADATILEVSQTTITKSEYLPIRYAEDDDSGNTPATVSELTTSTAVARLFDASTDESVIFWWQVPMDYVGGIKYRVYYGLVASTTTDSTAAFALAGCSVARGEALICSEGTAIIITQAQSTTTDHAWDLLVTSWSSAVDVTGIAAGEMARLLFYRDVSEDTISGDLGVIGLEVKYQAKINPGSDY